MKKFSFPLERVLAWRRVELEREEALLQGALTERDNIIAREKAVRQQRLDSEREISANPSIDATYISTLSNWQNAMKRAIASLGKEVIAVNHKVAQQQVRFTEAKRRVGLLERLREKRVDTWKAELSKEEEAFAAETFLYTRK